MDSSGSIKTSGDKGAYLVLNLIENEEGGAY